MVVIEKDAKHYSVRMDFKVHTANSQLDIVTKICCGHIHIHVTFYNLRESDEIGFCAVETVSLSFSRWWICNLFIQVKY